MIKVTLAGKFWGHPTQGMDRTNSWGQELWEETPLSATKFTDGALQAPQPEGCIPAWNNNNAQEPLLPLAPAVVEEQLLLSQRSTEGTGGGQKKCTPESTKSRNLLNSGLGEANPTNPCAQM